VHKDCVRYHQRPNTRAHQECRGPSGDSERSPDGHQAPVHPSACNGEYHGGEVQQPRRPMHLTFVEPKVRSSGSFFCRRVHCTCSSTFAPDRPPSTSPPEKKGPSQQGKYPMFEKGPVGRARLDAGPTKMNPNTKCGGTGTGSLRTAIGRAGCKKRGDVYLLKIL